MGADIGAYVQAVAASAEMKGGILHVTKTVTIIDGSMQSQLLASCFLWRP